MKKIIVIALCAVLPISAYAQRTASDKRIYCWNDNGQRVCGDALPASVAGQERDEISSRTGRTRQTIARSLTPEEMQQQQIEQQRVLDQQNIAQEQQRQEEQLLINFPREEDLLQAFAEQEEILSRTIQSSQASLTDSRKSVLEVLRRLAALELEGKPLPERQLAILQERRNQVVSQESDISRQQQQSIQLKNRHQQTLQQYRTLKSKHQSY